MATHELKTWPPYFHVTEIGQKKFDLRPDDRGYKVGDHLLLLEWDPKEERYTGRRCRVEVTFILRNKPEFGLMPGYCIMQFFQVSHRKSKTE